MIRILIADDHAIFRAGVKQVISDEPDMVVIGEAGTAFEALEKTRTLVGWDVLVLDIAMPDRNGLEVLHCVKREQPRQPVLMLSMYPEDQYAIRVLKAGASGYLTKESAPDQLVAAIRKVVMGGRYVSSALAEKLAARVGVGLDCPPHETLSNREFLTFCLIAQGKSSAEIAAELSVSIKTVATYRARIAEKTGMSRLAEIINYALQYRLLG